MLIPDVQSENGIQSSGWPGYPNGGALLFPLPDEQEGLVVGVLSLHGKQNSSFIQQDLEIGSILGSYSCETLRAIRAAEALHDGEARLRQVIENMPAMMAAYDDAGNIVVWNQECERVTGYRAAEIVGNPQGRELLYPDAGYRRRMTEEWRARGNDYRDWAWELTSNDGGKGTILWSDISARVPVPGWASWRIGIDVTERRQLEFRLRRAQKMEAVGQLAGGVAHDFNNMLQAILGNVHLARQRGESAEKYEHCLDEVHKAAERSADLTRQLLAFSRQQILQPEDVILSDIVTDMLKMIRRVIGEDIELDFAPGPNARSTRARSL